MVLSTAMRSAFDLPEVHLQPFCPATQPMNIRSFCLRLRPVRAISALACLVATTSQLRAGLPLLPEQIVVTCFSGTINYYASPPTATPNLGNNGYVIAKFDTQTGNIGPLIPPTTSPPHLWNPGDVPPFSGFHNETGQPWNAQRLEEAFGIIVVDAYPLQIY